MIMLLSVIIPIYNSSNTIDDTLESILRCKTEYSYEIILIDDGSTDESKTICQKYCRKYNNVKYEYKVNGGVASARNLGIKLASGNYIMFVDSDDEIISSGFENLNVFFNIDADIVCFSKNVVDGLRNNQKQILLGILGKGMYSNLHLECVWSKLYRRELLIREDINFIDGIINGEDMLFNIECVQKSKKIIFSQKSLYSYKKNLLSSTNSFNNRVFDSELLFNKELKNLLDLSDNDYLERYNFSTINGFSIVLQRIALSKNSGRNNLSKLINNDSYSRVISHYDSSNDTLLNRTVFYLIKNKRIAECLVLFKIKNFIKNVIYTLNKNRIEEVI